MELITPRQSSMGSLSFIAPVATQAIEEYYFSAPTSPRQISQFYREFDEFLINTSMRDDGRRNSVSSSVPFDWEVKPGIPKSVSMDMKFEDDFAFDVSQEMETASLSAEELFDGGKIRPLKPPPRSQFPHLHSTETSPMVSPRSHGSKKTNRRTLSPKQKKLNDHFGTGVENRGNKTPERQRGRERSSVSSLSSSRSGHRATRSLSPLRVSEYPWEEEYKQQQQQQHQNSKQSFTSSKESKPPLTSTTSALSSSSLKNYRKWRLKDFFLFRSASEGRATGKDPLKKYASLFKKHDELKSSSFRSIDNAGSSVSNSRRKGISAHELHYTMNRAVSEDLKKKTFLPYKQGILGRLAFNPAVHAIANGFGFSRK